MLSLLVPGVLAWSIYDLYRFEYEDDDRAKYFIDSDGFLVNLCRGQREQYVIAYVAVNTPEYRNYAFYQR